MDFTNKTVLVTGSSRGIGKAIAVAFGRAGARVVLNASRSKDQLEETKKEMEEMGVSCMAVLADVSDYNACKDMFLQIQDAFGPVDILVNNAGISHIGLFTDMTPEQWQHVLNVNLGSVLNCTHLAVPAMVHNKTGVILNISSCGEKPGLPVKLFTPLLKAVSTPSPKPWQKNLALPAFGSTPLPAVSSTQK